MTKYLLKRILHGLISVVIVVIIVMTLIYVFTNRENVFSADPLFTKKTNNDRVVYKHEKWEDYGYMDYVSYTDYLKELKKNGELDDETYAKVSTLPRKADNASDLQNEYINKFTEHYKSKGYAVERLDTIWQKANKPANGGLPKLFAHKDKPIYMRVFSFFGELIRIDNIHFVEDEMGEEIENPGLTFTFYDPVYNTVPETGEVEKKVFSPAIIGNGTRHKYLLYFDKEFPYIHQNLVSVRLGTSYAVSTGVDVFKTMTDRQGAGIKSMVTYPTGIVLEREDDLHTATYVAGDTTNTEWFTDKYSNLETFKENKSRLGFSFVIGLIASLLAYCVALPIGIVMARKKDKLVDKIGTMYIIFILACPSLAYIFMVQALGRAVGLPHYFDLQNETPLMYLLPIVSLAMPSIAGLMKWLRRYMIDQMNSDYVKFARSGGLSEGEIFRKHIFKNAAIPIIHGIPGSVLGALVGAIITEKIYYVPGAGNLLTNAIGKYDNAVIVGLTLFYALISITSVILGDILMALTDPRISFNSKAR